MTPVVRRNAPAGLLASILWLMAPTVASAQLQFETVKALAVNGSEGATPVGPMAELDGWIYGFATTPTQLFRFDPSDPAGTYAVVWTASVAGATTSSPWCKSPLWTS